MSLQKQNFLPRFLSGDATLWKEDPQHQKVIQNRLGWLRVHDWMFSKLPDLDRLQAQIRAEKIKDVVLLGMGGSSLAPEVMSLICKRTFKDMHFHVIDTTDPSSILKVERSIKLKSSIFIVASKSGSTIETTSQFQYFYEKMSKASPKPGHHFIAITDQGSSLEKLAAEKKFRNTFINPTDIGGRYSALSLFGMVPACLLGIDVRAILKSAREFFESFQKQSEIEKNPAVCLGVELAELAKAGKDKVTLWTSPALASFGSWLEQLVAESTGKEGTGIIPVDGDAPSGPDAYGKDRVFLVLKLKGDAHEPLKASIKKIKKAGFPVIEMEWPDAAAIGAEFLRWEIVTAVSAVVLKINPFDEPNVKESKDYTGRILDEFKQKGKLPVPPSICKAKSSIPLKAFFSKLKPGGYIAFLAYTERNAKWAKALNRLREKLKLKLKVPVLSGFGPRYLHSIGQLYKGGPRTGLFIEFLPQEKKDAKVPGQKYTFGQLKKAQALGDMQALESKGIPVLAIDLGKEAESGFLAFEKQVKDIIL